MGRLFYAFFIVLFIFNASSYADTVQISTAEETATLPPPTAHEGVKLSYNTPERDISLAIEGGSPSGLTSTAPAEVGAKAEDSQKVGDSTPRDAIKALYEVHGYDKAVENSLLYFSERIREKFSLWLARSERYLPVMMEIFAEKGLPEDLAFLPLIESGFNPRAYSRAKAVGYWQFIAGTAKRYGLKIDWWVDERRDPIKSTVAAAEYLKDLYDIFGSWNLALAAYNAGEGKIMRALSKSKTDDFWALRKTKHIKRETKNYIPYYIAATAIAKDPESFGFQDIDYHEPLLYDEVVIDSPIDISVIAECAETTVEEIKALNPELRRWCTPLNVSSYTVKIPPGKKEIFFEKLAAIAADELLARREYKIKNGDTVKQIAGRFGISTTAVLEMNSLNGKNPKLKTGDTLLIPPKEVVHLAKDEMGSKKSRKALKSRSKTGGVVKTSTKNGKLNRNLSS
ncbi:MAG: transglycosylase SLT domain-containing protein [Nitrospirae bacterium]|nr:transglycosylase SLT domain-containing protein [Nitrospirota bacterium]